MKKDYELDLDFIEGRLENALIEGISIKEIHDNFFYEMANDEKAVLTNLSRMIEHILKLAYCSSENYFIRDLYGWINSVEKQKGDLEKSSKHFKNKKFIRYIQNSLDPAYLIGKKFYEDDMDKNPSLEEYYEYIPDEFPWTEDEFMEFLKKEECNIGDLINELPCNTGFYEKYVLEDD